MDRNSPSLYGEAAAKGTGIGAASKLDWVGILDTCGKERSIHTGYVVFDLSRRAER
jgi:hypothetical protein